MPSMLNCSITEYPRLDCVFFAHECMRQIKESGSFLKAHTHMNIHIKQMPVALRMLGGVMCIGVEKTWNNENTISLIFEKQCHSTYLVQTLNLMESACQVLRNVFLDNCNGIKISSKMQF